MTVSSSVAKSGPYAGAGTTGPFTVGFRFLANSHLQVVKTATTGADSTLILDTDYTVAGAGGATGTVTLAVALAVGEKLTIVRSVPATQEADYVQNDAFPAESHETALDKLTMLAQQNGEAVGRAIKVRVSDAPLSELPSPSGRANTLIGFDATGNVTVLPITSSVGAGDRIPYTLVSGVDFLPGATTVTLPRAPGSKGNLELNFDGSVQEFAEWNVSDVTVTFTAPIPAYITKIWGYIGTTLSTQIPPADSVGDTQLTWGTVLNRVVDSIVGLKALSSAKYKRVFVTDYYGTGDGGGGHYYYDAADTTSADNGGTIIVATDSGRWKLIHNGTVSVRQFGAKGDGIAIDTTAFRNAAATGLTIHAEEGTYLLNDSVTFPVFNQRIFGDGRFRTIIQIKSTFNMSAAGVFISGNTGVEYDDLAILFEQPDTAIIGNITHYPAAISGLDRPGQRIRRCRISRAWIGVDWRDNAGQSTIDDLICSFFDTGIWLDGALDSIRINDPHLWPTDLTVNQTTLMTTGGAVGIRSGRADDFKTTGGLFFCDTPFNFFSGTRVNAGPTFGTIENADLDGFGGIVMSAGTLNVVGGFQSGATLGKVKLNQSGGTLTYSGVNFQVGADFPESAFSSFLNLSGTAVCNIIGGSIFKPNDACVANISAGQFSMSGVSVVHQSNATFLKAFIQVGGTGQATAIGNTCSPLGTGAMPFFTALVDGNHVVKDNVFFGHTINVPAGVGSYGGNHNSVANSEIYNNDLIGNLRVRRLVSTLDGGGALTIAHGVPLVHQKLLSVSAVYKGASGEAKPMTVVSVDGTNVIVSGGAASAKVRISLYFSQAVDAW